MRPHLEDLLEELDFATGAFARATERFEKANTDRAQAFEEVRMIQERIKAERERLAQVEVQA